jgi:hypothetical protein
MWAAFEEVCGLARHVYSVCERAVPREKLVEVDHFRKNTSHIQAWLPKDMSQSAGVRGGTP